jgi:flavorubredoxin
MWATLHLSITADTPEKMAFASTIMAKAATQVVDKSMDATLSVHHFDPDKPEDVPDWEKMYTDLEIAVNNLAAEWSESGTQYKAKLAEELRFRTGITR